MQGLSGNDHLQGNSGHDSLEGGAGNDTLEGGSGNDTLNAGTGNDTAQGGWGSDTYVFNRGDGELEIIDQDHQTLNSSYYQRYGYYRSTDVLQLGEGISRDDLSITKKADGYTYIRIKDSDDVIKFASSHNKYRVALDRIDLADGSSISQQELIESVMMGSDGDDTLVGGSYNDTLDAGTGNDSAQGGWGSDTYVFNRGDGELEIIDQDHQTLNSSYYQRYGYYRSTDVLQLGEGIGKGDLSITKEADGYTYIRIQGSDDVIKFASTTNRYEMALDRIDLADGRSIGQQELMAGVISWGTEQIAVNDLGLYKTEDGLIANSSPTDQSGIFQYQYYEGYWDQLPDFSQLTAVTTGYSDSIDLSHKPRDNGIGVVFSGQITIDQGGEYTFFTRSDDGSKLYIDDVEIVDNDGLHGSRERQGSAELAKGQYNIRVEFFEKEGGEVLEVNFQGPDTENQKLALNVHNASANSADITGITTAPLKHGLTLDLAAVDDYKTGWHDDNTLTAGNHSTALLGLGGEDRLTGSDYQDILIGGSGNDILKGGKGDDIYVFSRSTQGGEKDAIDENYMGQETRTKDVWSVVGQEWAFVGGSWWAPWTWWEKVDVWDWEKEDYIVDVEKTDNIDSQDTIKFDGSITIADLTKSSVDGDIILRIKNPHSVTGEDDQITILNDNVEYLEFANGTKVRLDALLFGHEGQDNLMGSDQQDILVGGAGNDFLSGGAGSDIYVITAGSETDVIDNYDADADSIDIARFENVSYEDLWFSRTANDLQINVVGTDDQVTVSNWYDDADYQLGRIEASTSALLNSQVDQLVNAMATYDIPSGAGGVVPQEVKDELQMVLGESWQKAA